MKNPFTFGLAIAMLAVGCAAYAFDDDPMDEAPACPTIKVTPAVITSQAQIATAPAPAKTAVVQPVALVVHKIAAPLPKKGWFWTTKPTADEFRALASIYDRYDNVAISPQDMSRLTGLLRLMASGAGARDQELEQLFYYTVFRIPVDHPAKAFLDKKLIFTTRQLSENTQEYNDFTSKMTTVAQRYGLE